MGRWSSSACSTTPHYVALLTEGAAPKALATRSEYFSRSTTARSEHLSPRDRIGSEIDDQSPPGPTPKRRIFYDSRRALLDSKRDVIAMNLDRFAGDPSALNSLSGFPLAGESFPMLTRSPYACTTAVLVEPMWCTAVTYQVSGCRLVLVVHPGSADRFVDLVTGMALAMLQLYASRLALGLEVGGGVDAEWIRRTRRPQAELLMAVDAAVEEARLDRHQPAARRLEWTHSEGRAKSGWVDLPLGEESIERRRRLPRGQRLYPLPMAQRACQRLLLLQPIVGEYTQ